MEGQRTYTIDIKEKKYTIKQGQIKFVFEKTTMNQIEQYRAAPLYLLNQAATSRINAYYYGH